MGIIGKSKHAETGATEAPRDSKEFFTWAREQVSDALSEFAEKADEYDDIGEFTEDQFDHLWPIVDRISKASFRNGRQKRRSK